MTKWKGWKAVVRDVVMLWILTGIGGFIIGVATVGSELPIGAVALSNVILGIIGFCISGCMMAENRWRHLFIVALFVWLTSIVNIFVGPFSFMNWLLGMVVIFIMLAVGGGISFLIVKPRQNTSVESQQNN